MDDKNELKEKQVRIIWDSDEDLPALYANHLYISHSGEMEFHLIFGHLSPPLTIGMDESELPEYIKIKPIAKIVVSPASMKKFVEALDSNLLKFESKQKE